MSPLASAGFQLRKWYLDCVADDGSAVVAYRARLRWGPLRLHYAAVLDAPAAGVPRQFHTLRSDASPHLRDDACSWQCARLGVSGRWMARAAPVRRVLLRTARGGIEWHCHQPAADARVEIRRRDGTVAVLHGTGYVEELSLTLPPWRLPFDTLWWGRFVAPDASLVWIRWRGRSNRGLAAVDGTVHLRPRVREGGVAVAGAAALRFHDHRPLRDGPLGSTALRGLPALVRMLPPAFRAARETKQISRAELRRPGHEPVRGWAIHEVVQW
jgi:hypothetical protein